MRRYLLVQVVLPAALINFAINYLAGRALFAPGRAVPLWGNPGMALDVVAGSFLISLLTLLLVVPGARREAQAGRARGRGWTGAWTELVRRRPGTFAVAGAAGLTTLFAGAAIGLWSATGVDAMARDAFVWLKATLSAGVGVGAALVAAAVGIGVEPPAPDDPRWCKDPAREVGGPIYPCQYLDKGGLVVTSRAHGCSATPTWHLVVRGALAPAHVRQALADLLVRYPSLATKVQALDGVPTYATHFRYAYDRATSVDDLFAVRDLRDAPGGAEAALTALLAEEHDRFCDLFAEPPMTVTLAITADHACHLIVRQHHAIADGRAFIGLLGDLARYLEAARRGERPPADALAPVHRRDELEALGLSPTRRALDTVAGVAAVLAMPVRGALRPLTPLRQNRSNDYTGHNGTVHWTVPDAEVARWKAAGKAIGVSLNSLLTGALFVANQRWHRGLGAPTGRTSAILAMETRPRDASFVSFANHLATLEVALDLGRPRTVAELAREIQAQVEQQRTRRTPIKRMLGERFFVRMLPLDALQKVVFESKRPSRSLDFSNLIALDFPTLAGDGWEVEAVRITTPVAPRGGVVLTVIHYRGSACFNFNYKSSAIPRAEVEQIKDQFAAVLAEV